MRLIKFPFYVVIISLTPETWKEMDGPLDVGSIISLAWKLSGAM